MSIIGQRYKGGSHLMKEDPLNERIGNERYGY